MSVDLTRVAPWSDDTPDLLTRTLTHTATAAVVMPDGESVDLSIEEGSVDFDETRSPRAGADLTCKVPEEQALLDRIDPRTGARLVIAAGYSRPDGVLDVQPLVDLALRSRTVTRPADLMNLNALGDESLIVDDAPSNGGTVTGSNTVEAIKQTIRRIFPGVPVTTTLTGAAINQNPVGDKWTAIADLSDRLEAQTYDDGLRNWFITTAPVTTTPAIELKVGAGGTVIDSEAGMDRDTGWYNRVFITYQWTDNADVEHKVVTVRSITSGPYAATVGNTRTLELQRDTPTTQAQADAAATALVKRTVTRGRAFTVSAPSAYWLRPGMTASITLPLGDAEEHLVTAVSFDLRQGRMRVTTRLPDFTGTIGA